MNNIICKIEDLRNNMKITASSYWRYYKDTGEFGKTHLLQEINSGSYFLFDQFSVKYDPKDEVELKPFKTNLDEKSLKRIIRNTEGLLNLEEFKEDINLQFKLKRISKNLENIDLN